MVNQSKNQLAKSNRFPLQRGYLTNLAGEQS
jgi:hypothetical protein